jgi:hypothetical protein
MLEKVERKIALPNKIDGFTYPLSPSMPSDSAKQARSSASSSSIEVGCFQSLSLLLASTKFDSFRHHSKRIHVI